MTEIDKNSPIPIYHQLKEIIKKKIESEEYKPGDRIPTEQDLCDTFDISRTPVRQALSELVNENLLNRKRGRGTFINNYSYLNVKRIKALIPEKRWEFPLRQAVKIWNEKNPGNRVKLDIFRVGLPQLRFKIIAAVARGQAPDLALIDSVYLSELADLDFLMPIEKLDQEWLEDEYKKDFFPVFIKSNSYQHKIFGIQPESDMTVIWYRKDWFTAEGISPPQTWEELIETGQHFGQPKVRKKYGLNQYPLAFSAGLRAGETTAYQLLPFLWSTGTEVFENGKVLLGEKARLTLEFLSDLVNKYKLVSPKAIYYEWDQTSKLLAEDKVALSVGGSYEKALICATAGWDDQQFLERVGFTPIPSSPEGKQTVVSGGMSYVIFRQARFQKLALEILKLATSPQLMKKFCLQTGQNPSRLSVAKSLDPVKDRFLYETSKFLYDAKVRPTLPEYPLISEQLQIMMENAVSGNLSVQEAVNKAEQIISALLRGGSSRPRD